MNAIRKLLILDGIGGVPLGREVAQTFAEQGIPTTHIDCIAQARRPFHAVQAAWAKLQNRREQRDGFYFLPKLDERAFLERIADERPSHILVIGFLYKFLAPQQLRALATQLGARLLLYDTDSCNLYGRRREFIFFLEEELPVYDRILSFSGVTTHFFRDTRGLDAHHVPFAALPIALPRECPSHEVLFVGSGDLRRIFLLEAIRDRVSVHGSRWVRNWPLISHDLQNRIHAEEVWGAPLHALLGGARIVLNITRTDFYGAETGINLRIFEALAAGAFLLTDHCDEIAELFRVGEEIETFRSSSELKEKVDWYLAHENSRQAIAEAGREAFLRRHTWQTRIREQMIPLMENHD